MDRLSISTRGIGSWRERLGNPDKQWRRGFSAFETAVSWECAKLTISGVPEPVAQLFRDSEHGEPTLLFSLAEHKVGLLGEGAASQCDLWAVLKTNQGMVSLTVEAKAKEAFGVSSLDIWLTSGESESAAKNRITRWDHIRENLPVSDAFAQVRYQILHRCAASIIEAKRLGIKQAAFVIQAFNTPHTSFQDYARFCQAIGIAALRGQMATTQVGDITLGVGWADCPLATDKQVAATA